MTRIAFRYSSIGLSFRGVGLVTSNVMFAIARSRPADDEVYTINQVDAESTTFAGSSVVTPRGGLEVPGFPTHIRGKILSVGIPGEISLGSRATNKIELKVFENDGQMTQLFSYQKYVPGLWLVSPSDVLFEGIAEVGYIPSMRRHLFDYLFQESRSAVA